MKNISVQEFKDALSQTGNNSDIAFIDVCSRDEYAEKHIQGVRNIPLDELHQHLNELQNNKTIYIHCFSGGRSQMACYMLEGQGVKAELFNMDGGILAWQRAGFPTV